MNYVFRNFASYRHFNYDQHGRDWIINGGKRQSPIPLGKMQAVSSKAPKLTFLNYNKTFAGPLKLTNNGHTATMPIPPGYDGTQPAVCGCNLMSVYKAVQLHFHWGSSNTKGSEHTMESLRYDGELHILHQNTAYELQTDALYFPDGFVVLGILLKIVPDPTFVSRALRKVCHKASSIRDYNTSSTFEGNFSLRDILTGIERREFFSYKGSLTTPPCSEVVDWFVFPKPIEVSTKCLQNFWLLTDDLGKPLINNYRALQYLNGRNLYYRNEPTPNHAK